MTPRVSVLQLDTQFPRIPGDIAAAETYLSDPEVIVVNGARVDQIVTRDPSLIDVQQFIDAAKASVGDIVTTSCGFLAPFENLIAHELDRPFLASSLCALPQISMTVSPTNIQVMTFDEECLGDAHFPAGMLGRIAGVIGLPRYFHLAEVIRKDLYVLNPARAKIEILGLLDQELFADIRCLVLECTNLPPYKTAIREKFGIETYDILDRIEATSPGSIRPDFI